jgi:hypothetical protein
MENEKTYTSEFTVENSATVKIKDNYYKFQYSETKTLLPGTNVEEERKKLIDRVNQTIDTQISELLDSLVFTNNK